MKFLSADTQDVNKLPMCLDLFKGGLKVSVFWKVVFRKAFIVDIDFYYCWYVLWASM